MHGELVQSSGGMPRGTARVDRLHWMTRKTPFKQLAKDVSSCSYPASPVTVHHHHSLSISVDSIYLLYFTLYILQLPIHTNTFIYGQSYLY
jgi:hypothetical protein